ncbi:hypothetical protein HY408_00015, partial [Candidatus Gottesmanbacteria bacterium]|nr:hypothetical protein [Candidatus Gottesmanbacteria bacterium]
TLWYFFREPGSRREHVLKSHLVGLGCLLALLTKNIAFALPATVMLLLLKEHRWKDLFVIAGYSFVGAAIHPLLGLMYDWNLYTGVLEEYRRAHALGLPETLASVFLYPVIGHKEKIFLDGAMLAGYLLLFTSPFWLLKKENTSGNVQAVVAYPLIYFTALALLEGGRTWFGWHLFPLYPFLSLALAAALYRAYKEANALSFMFFFLSLGASSLRFFLVLNPSEIELWQRYLGFILLVGLAGLTVPGKQIKYAVLVGFFAVFLLLQIITVINLGNIYRPLPQPAAYTHISTIH